MLILKNTQDPLKQKKISFTCLPLFSTFFIFFFLFSPLFNSSCLPLLEAQQFDDQVIDSISVSLEHLPTGSHYSSESILKELKTKEKGIFSQNTLDEDLKALSKKFDQVIPSLELINDRVHITLVIWPKSTIRSISWEGNKAMKTERLEKELGIKPQTTFDKEAFVVAIHKIKNYYNKKGFFESNITYTLDENPETLDLDVTISIAEGRAGKIKNILFKNFTKAEENATLDLLLTKKYNFLTSLFSDSGTYNQEMAEQDKLIVVNYFQNLGYADTSVTFEIEELKSKNRINIIISVDKGQNYKVGNITVKGYTLFTKEKIASLLQIKQGFSYSPDALRSSIYAITKLYGSKGYIDAYVNYTPLLQENHPIYDIEITIEEGSQYHIGLVKVFGNFSTHTDVILHETTLIPSEIFNSKKLDETEAKLQATGYFKNVNVYAIQSSEMADNPDYATFRDVYIEVEEQSTATASGSVGFSTLESAFGSINISEKNFYFKGLPSLFCDGYQGVRGGGEYFNISSTFGLKHTDYGISWTKPFFMDTPWIIGFDIEKTRNSYQSDNYDLSSLSGELHAKYNVNQFLRFGWLYRIKKTNITPLVGASQHIVDEKKKNGITSLTGISLMYDSTNNATKPTKGFRSHAGVDYAGLGGKHSFLSLNYLNTYYISLHENRIMKFRVDFSFLMPTGSSNLDSLPLAERLFTGGETSVRGYKAYSIGPYFMTKAEDEEDKIPKRIEPKGGLTRNVLSVEYNHQVHERADLFVFSDAGMVSHKEFHFGEYRLTSGYGVKVKIFPSTPPIALGFAHALNPEKTEKGLRKDRRPHFFMSLGARF